MRAYDEVVNFLRKMTFFLHSYTYPVAIILERRISSILDVGCGTGYKMRFINQHRKVYSVGVDVFIRYIKGQSVHHDYVLGDARFLPFKKKSFDAVICLQVIEHISKKDGLMLLKDMEEIARKQVVVTTPIGFMPREEVDGNPYERHVSSWRQEEFEELGYTVKRQNIRILFGNGGIVHLKPFSLLSRCVFLIEPLLNLFFFFIPIGDYYLLCNRNLDSSLR